MEKLNISDMEKEIKEAKELFFEEIKHIKDDLNELMKIKGKFIGRKDGLITKLIKELPNLPSEAKAKFGSEINKLKKEIEEEIEKISKKIEAKRLSEKLEEDIIDITLPSRTLNRGTYHPIYIVRKMIEDIFKEIGYSIVDGPEIETEYYNFDALHFPKEHPARDMQATLFLKNGLLLRTHTSPVQIRTMLENKPPLRILCPGKVYRADPPDAGHSPIFHQIEGLAVDERITLGDLKGTLEYFITRLFGKEILMRFRPSYFPFTCPSAEVDITCLICKGKGCSACKNSGWMEILGAGIVDPAVFEAVGYNPEKYTGFAFGLGIDRITMLLYNIHDIRLFLQNDIRFLSQFYNFL